MFQDERRGDGECLFIPVDDRQVDGLASHIFEDEFPVVAFRAGNRCPLHLVEDAEVGMGRSGGGCRGDFDVLHPGVEGGDVPVERVFEQWGYVFSFGGFRTGMAGVGAAVDFAHGIGIYPLGIGLWQGVGEEVCPAVRPVPVGEGGVEVHGCGVEQQAGAPEACRVPGMAACDFISDFFAFVKEWDALFSIVGWGEFE